MLPPSPPSSWGERRGPLSLPPLSCPPPPLFGSGAATRGSAGPKRARGASLAIIHPPDASISSRAPAFRRAGPSRRKEQRKRSSLLSFRVGHSLRHCYSAPARRRASNASDRSPSRPDRPNGGRGWRVRMKRGRRKGRGTKTRKKNVRDRRTCTGAALTGLATTAALFMRTGMVAVAVCGGECEG